MFLRAKVSMVGLSYGHFQTCRNGLYTKSQLASEAEKRSIQHILKMKMGGRREQVDITLNLTNLIHQVDVA